MSPFVETDASSYYDSHEGRYGTSVGDSELDPQDPRVFGPPGSGSISHRYGSGDRDPHQNVTDPQHWQVGYLIGQQNLNKKKIQIEKLKG